MVKGNYTDGEMVPRLISTVLGDIFTTNAFGANDSDSKEVAGIELKETDYVEVDSSTGYLKASTAEGAAPLFQVAKVYTMADGQPGVKLIRVK